MEPFSYQAENTPGVFKLVPWMESDRRLVAGLTSRIGGVSKSGFASFNVALHVDDQPARVIENRKRLTDVLNFPFESWTCAEQVHGSRIAVVTEQDRGSGKESRESAIQDTDGLITNERGILLTSFYADCVPLYFYDPDHEVVGLAHAGWKGTAAAIAEKMIIIMQKEFGCKVDRIRAAIGPAIGSCCYEVDDQVIHPMLEQLGTKLQKNDHSLLHGMTKKPNGRYDMDLKDINRQIMIKAGISEANLEITGMCTSCESSRLFSHRRDRGKTGRMASYIGISET